MEKNHEKHQCNSVSIPVEAEDESAAMEMVSKAVSEGDSDMMVEIGEALSYSVRHNDCIVVTDAVEAD